MTELKRSTDQHTGTASANTSGQIDAVAELGRIGSAVDTARSAASDEPGSAQFLVALALLRQVREQLAVWEPELIDAARANGASWAQLAPALGLGSRQAAERRALRLRTGGEQEAVTGEQRVVAERDRRAQVRAVDVWARGRSADLRILAAQIGALTGLAPSAGAPMAALHEALGDADPALLLQALLETRPHLGSGHEHLAAQIDALGGGAEAARAESRARRSR
jgi:hypothetical protein